MSSHTFTVSSRQLLLAGAAVLAGLALLSLTCGKDDDAGKIPAELERKADSLAASRPAFEERRDSVVQILVRDTLESRRLARAAKAARDSAEGSRLRADSIAALASSQRDSAALWRAAYDARTQEAEQLRRSLDSAQAARAAELLARAELTRLWGEAERRRQLAEETVIPGLRDAIARLEKPCRLLGPIPCPSRRASALAGAAATLAAIAATR